MLKTCEDFTKENNIKFSVHEDPSKSKSKCLYVVGLRPGVFQRPAPLVLCGRPLPWVERAEHLGNTLHQDGTMRQDCKEKRAQFIDSSVKINEAFYFAHPCEKIKAIEKYCTAMYGSNLWRLDSNEVQSVISAWKTGVKLAWGVHRGCRTYLLQNVLAPDTTPLRVGLLTKFHGFFRSLLDSPSHEVAVIARLTARDIRTNLGSNLALLKRETGLDPWVTGKGQLDTALKNQARVNVPKQDGWRVPYLRKLLSERLRSYYSSDQQEEKRIQRLIDSLIVN